MQTPVLLNARPTGLSTSVASYTGFSQSSTGGAWQSSDQNARTPMPYAGTISNLYVNNGNAGSAPITTGSYKFEFLVGGVAQSTTVTLDSTHQSASDTSNSFSVSAGDFANIRVTPTGAPTALTIVQISFVFTSSATGKSVVFAFFPSGTTQTFGGLGLGATSGTEVNVQVPCPTAGTFESIYASLGTAPGSGNSRTFTLNKATVASALAVTISNASTNNSATASVSVVQGDILSLNMTVSTPAASPAWVALGFAPTTDGESLLFGISNGAQGTAQRYLSVGSGTDSSTEANNISLAPVNFVLQKLTAVLSVAPTGASKTRTFTVQSGASTPLSASSETLTFTNTEGLTAKNDNVHTLSVTAGQFCDVTQTTANSPSNSVLAAGVVSYIAPPATGATAGGGPMMGMVG